MKSGPEKQKDKKGNQACHSPDKVPFEFGEKTPEQAEYLLK